MEEYFLNFGLPPAAKGMLVFAWMSLPAGIRDLLERKHASVDQDGGQASRYRRQRAHIVAVGLPEPQPERECARNARIGRGRRCASANDQSDSTGVSRAIIMNRIYHDGL